jgi:hypothetical protein
MNYKDSDYYKKFQKFINEEEEILGSTEVIPLSKVDKNAAQAAISGGTQDGSKPDDVIAGKKVNVAVKNLRAAQTEIIPGKAIGIALYTMLGNPISIGGDLGSIISKDNFIMDGHHRWAATFLCDPNGQVQAMQIDLPGPALVNALNVITVGKFGKNGNPGTGNIKNFTGSVIGPMLDKIMENGMNGMSAEEVKIRLGRVPGANGDANKGKELMMQNADALPKNIMPGAPDRVDMPVIDTKQVALVQKFLEKGVVDLKPPYSPDVKKALGLEFKIQKRLNNYLKESIKKSSK